MRRYNAPHFYKEIAMTTEKTTKAPETPQEKYYLPKFGMTVTASNPEEALRKAKEASK